MLFVHTKRPPWSSLAHKTEFISLTPEHQTTYQNKTGAKQCYTTTHHCKYSVRYQSLMTLIISVRDTTPSSNPCSSTTQTRCTLSETTFSTTSPSDDSGRQVTCSFHEDLTPVLGAPDSVSKNSRTSRFSRGCIVDRGHPLKSVAEKVPTSFLFFPCKNSWKISWYKLYIIKPTKS